MKWPAYLMLIRHDTSAHNILRDKKKADPLYREFLASFEKNHESQETRTFAAAVQQKFALGIGDADTPLVDKEGRKAYLTGKALKLLYEAPDVVFVSPYKRALLTLEHITRGWPKLARVKTYKDERVREQEHGMILLYNDWRVFQAMHPEQKRIRDLGGAYWYRFPQGESMPDVRERNRSWLNTLTRDFREKKVMVVTHHLNILATRANLERLDAERFIQLDRKGKRVNCGVTLYRGNPDKGSDGRLELKFYNKKFS